MKRFVGWWICRKLDNRCLNFPPLVTSLYTTALLAHSWDPAAFITSVLFLFKTVTFGLPAPSSCLQHFVRKLHLPLLFFDSCRCGYKKSSLPKSLWTAWLSNSVIWKAPAVEVFRLKWSFFFSSLLPCTFLVRWKSPLCISFYVELSYRATNHWGKRGRKRE